MDQAAFEREFLIKLAAVYLGCNWQAMGNPVDTPWMKGCGDLAFSLLGMVDYGNEMKLVCQARLRSTLKP